MPDNQIVMKKTRKYLIVRNFALPSGFAYANGEIELPDGLETESLEKLGLIRALDNKQPDPEPVKNPEPPKVGGKPDEKTIFKNKPPSTKKS